MTYRLIANDFVYTLDEKEIPLRQYAKRRMEELDWIMCDIEFALAFMDTMLGMFEHGTACFICRTYLDEMLELQNAKIAAF